ncbi:MAG: hypothetical protein Q9220_000364 [cf. Caloplaca sp. 1 TL-2023]
MDDFSLAIRQNASAATKVLTPLDTDFAAANERWTNIDHKTPRVIVQPATEADIAVVVKASHNARLPFVAATGGHSQWSTVEDGVIIDLSQYREIVVDVDEHAVTVRGGVLMKELQVALSEKHQFTTVANGNTVGVIPYIIGGGISSYTPLIGYACENILSARVVVASGEIIVADETKNRDVLWAVRGAGQFFGVVTELVVRTYDRSLMGPAGVRQLGTIFYPPERAFEVCGTLDKVVSANDHASSGHFMVMNDPDKGHILMVAVQYFGTGPELQQTFKPLIDLVPLDHNHQPSNFEKHSDHLSWMCHTGDFKRFSQTGLSTINPRNFSRLVNLHRELLDTVPGTERSVFTIEWHTSTPSHGPRETPTSFGLKNIDVWLNILTWYTDPTLHAQVLHFDKKAQEIMRSETKEEAFVAYTNTSRSDPIEHRYKDPDAVKELKRLKQEWDPDGCFTMQLL